MRKIVIAGLVASIVAGSGLIAALHVKETAAAAPVATDSSASASAAAPTATDSTKPAGQADKRPGKKPARSNEACPPDGTAAKPDNAGRSASNASNTSTIVQGDYTVTISGGFDTDPVDHGRPVVLIAAALGVPTEVFREAFSGVTPAGLDRGPTDEEAQSNKAALLKVLSPYGITNDKLDEVSNYYRYNGKKEGVWKRTLATATPVITDGKLTGITITNAGSGYSSAPTVTIKGPDDTVTTATATVSYTKDFATNGSLSSIKLNS